VFLQLAFVVCYVQNRDNRLKPTDEKQEASTHKSAKTHAGNVFVPCDLDLLTLK